MKFRKIFLIILACAFVIGNLQAQDGVFKYKTIHLSFKKMAQNDSLINLELFQNGEFIGRGLKSQCTRDSLPNSYKLSYSYSGIGGGRSDNYLHCPELFVKLNFADKIILIPIVLEVCYKTKLTEIKVSDIDLSSLVNQKGKVILVSENSQYKIIDETELENPLVKKELIKIE